MRDQYKVLSEKYNQVQEAEKTTSPLTPEETAVMINKILDCRSQQDLVNVAASYYKRYDDYTNTHYQEFWFDADTLKSMINRLSLPEGVNILYQAFGRALQYLYQVNSFGLESRYVKDYKKISKRAWDKWWEIYEPYLKAKEDLTQKNKETGINLDI